MGYQVVFSDYVFLFVPLPQLVIALVQITSSSSYTSSIAEISRHTFVELGNFIFCVLVATSLCYPACFAFALMRPSHTLVVFYPLVSTFLLFCLCVILTSHLSKFCLAHFLKLLC